MINAALGVLGVIFVAFGFVVMRGAPYVPTLKKQLDRAFDELYPLTAKDTVIDLGSGDGAVLAAAAKRGARAVGYELNPLLVWFSRLLLVGNKKTQVFLTDYLRMDVLPPDATVVYAFSTGHSIDSIGKKLVQWSAHQELYFVSFGFQLTDVPVLRSSGPMHLYRFKKS